MRNKRNSKPTLASVQARHGCARRCPQQRRRGLTLIEILVVLVIIALLAAIAFPVFSSARETARRATCQANMQQLGLAFSQYIADYQRYPGGGQFQKWGDGGHWVTTTLGDGDPTKNGKPSALADLTAPFTWSNATADVEHGALYAYAKNPTIYYCPSNLDGEDKHLSYSMNCAIAGMRSNRVKSPQDIVLLIDEESAADGWFYADNPASPYVTTDALTQLHTGGGNLLFVDGHVKFYPFKNFPLDDTTAGRWNKTARPGKTPPAGLAAYAPGTPRFWDDYFDDQHPASTSTGYYTSPAFGSCTKPAG